MLQTRESVLGITFSEVAFTLLFAAVISGVLIFQELNVEGALAEERARRAAVEQGELRRKLQELGEKLNEKQGKLSDIPPACLGGPLFEATIDRGKRYLVGGVVHTLNELATRYGDEIANARRIPCVHRVAARISSGLTADEYVAGLKGLELYFYVRKE